jgi:hypothetical protein
MVTWTFRYSDGVVQHLCDACGRKQAAHLDARLPREHEYGATTRKGKGRTGWTVTVLRAPQTDEWLYSVQCAHCEGPTTDEINHFLKTGD